jgi:PAS domain S-box-containing protein
MDSFKKISGVRTRSIGLLSTGAIIIGLVCLLQSFTDIFHGTVYFLITGFFLLWYLRHENYFHLTGLMVSAGICIGYIYGEEHGTGPLINRIFSVFIFWLLVRFAMRYKKLSAEESKNRNQLDALFRNVSEAILLVDENGVIVMGNPGAVKIFGYSASELIGMQVENLIPAEYHAQHAVFHTGSISANESRQVTPGKEILGLKKGGKGFPVDLGLSSYHENGDSFVIAFITDITRRREQEEKILSQYQQLQEYNAGLESEVKLRTAELYRALDAVKNTNENLLTQIEERMEVEDRLRKSQALYRAVARNFPDGVIGILNNEMKYVFVEGREMKGYLLNTHNNVNGVFDGLHKLVLERFSKDIRKAFEGEKITFEFGAGSKHYDVIATPLRESERPAREVLIVVRNITRFKEYEEGLKVALEKEKQLNAMKSRFVSNVSHEFRTPLTTILSSVFLLENYRKDEATANWKNHISRIRRSINTLTELLEDFLSLEKLSEGKVEVHHSRFSLKNFLADFLGELEAIKKKDQHLDLTCHYDADIIVTDKAILANILNNLGSNAIKYSPSDGNIMIRVKVASDNMELSVSDNGMGIPEGEQKHIFERFFRAQNAVNIQGTGLGLNLVMKYVTLLNGDITFSSTMNSGSTFVVVIPVNRNTGEKPVVEEHPSAEFA